MPPGYCADVGSCRGGRESSKVAIGSTHALVPEQGAGQVLGVDGLPMDEPLAAVMHAEFKEKQVAPVLFNHDGRRAGMSDEGAAHGCGDIT